MSVNIEAYAQIKKELDTTHTSLVAVSKFKTTDDILALYEIGQRDFGENFVQELLLKEATLPKDIRWHFIGHLQSNKVKYIAPFVYLIHGADSEKLLKEIDKQAARLNKKISCLLQVFIADEKTKYGFDEAELKNLSPENYPNIKFEGLMGMATFTEDQQKIKKEFKYLTQLYNEQAERSTINYQLSTLSMGMSADYKLAIEEGSNMVRIGSLLFGQRNHTGNDQ